MVAHISDYCNYGRKVRTL